MVSIDTLCESLQANTYKDNGLDLGMVQGDAEMQRVVAACSGTSAEIRDYLSLHTHRLSPIGMETLAKYLHDREMRHVCLTSCFGGQSTIPTFLETLGKRDPEGVHIRKLSLAIEVDTTYSLQEAEAVEEFFANNTSIQHLELKCYGTNLKSNPEAHYFLSSLVSGLTRNTSLRILDVHVCRGIGLGGVHASVLKQSMMSCKGTGHAPATALAKDEKPKQRPEVRVWIRHNDLSFATWLQLSHFLQANDLHAINVSLAPRNREALKTWVAQSQSLRSLSLVNIQDACLSEILPVLSHHLTVQKCYIALERGLYSDFTADDASVLGEILKTNTTLRKLSFVVHRCQPDGVQMLARSLLHIQPQLEVLEMNMRIVMSSARPLFKTLLGNTTLTQVKGLRFEKRYEKDAEEWAKLKGDLQQALQRNVRNRLLRNLLQDGDADNPVPDSIWPHVLESLSKNEWHDTMYMACREQVLLRQR